jgi:renin receptor
MNGKLATFFAIITAVTCNELVILNSPKSVEFKGSSDLPSESLSDVFGASLGYSVSSNLKWDGLFIHDPFNTAESVVVVVVEGLEQLNVKNGETFNVLGSSNFDESLQSKVLEHSHLAMDVDLSGNSEDKIETIVGELSSVNIDQKVEFLKPKTNRYDLDVLKQIAFLDSLSELISQGSELPSAIVAKLSLKLFIGEHSQTSPAATEAVKLLLASIEKLNQAVQKAFNKNVVVAVVSIDDHAISRTKRQAEQEGPTDYNLAPTYSKYYPVMFNIIFWFSIILLFSLLAISLSISGMEDKDSIIYRMTSTRIKKDN